MAEDKEGLTAEELAAQSGEALPDREVMSILPVPDGGFVYIEPTDTTDPPPPEETEDGGQVSW
jgi:hypothetical protein